MSRRAQVQSSRKPADAKVVVLAGGYGTRLAERTDEIPKPMVHVGGMPILWHILKIYSHFGFDDFVIACGYRSEVIKRFFLEYRQQKSDLLIDLHSDRITRLNGHIEPWRIALIDTGAATNTGGRIKRLKEHFANQTFLLTYGDGVADVDLRELLKFHKSHGKLATFTAVKVVSPFGIPTIKGNQVVAFEEKPPERAEWVNGGFFALEPGVVDYIQDDSTSFELESLGRLAKDGQLMAFRHTGFWHAMDTLRDVRKLNFMWETADAKWKVWH